MPMTKGSDDRKATKNDTIAMSEHIENTIVEPIDDRNPDVEWTIDSILSSSNTNYGGEDPAIIEEPKGTPAEKAIFENEEPTSEVEA